MTDFPLYTIKPNTTRMLISSILLTALLAVVFYVGIAVNSYLLGMTIPGSVNILIIAVLVLLVIIQASLTYLQVSKTQYLVYSNRIQIEGLKKEYIMFNAMEDIKAKRNVFDRLLNTGTAALTQKIKLKAIPNFDQTFVYLKQMIQYSRMQYNRL